MAKPLPEIGTILYCTDIGPNAPYVFQYAYVLARRLDAKIVVLHVVETLSRVQEAMVEGYSGQSSIHPVVEHEEREADERLRRRIHRFCTKVVGEPEGEQVVDRVIVAEGRVRPQILKHVELVGADLVVMGAHAESSLIDALLGNTAQKVAASCPVPVLMMQVPEGHQEMSFEDD